MEPNLMLLNNPDLLQRAASDQACAGQHFGPWCIEPRWFSQAVMAVNAGRWPIRPAVGIDMKVDPGKQNAGQIELYRMTADGVALVRILGHMTKTPGSFGGTSTIRTRMALRAAAADKKVKGILLTIDSPGGTAAGTMELADDVFATRQHKPLHGYIEDIGASAAYWVGSQAGRLTANATAQIGSIGTVAIVEDMSEMAGKLGIKVHVISTGPYKGAFAKGTEVTKAHLEYAQEIVDDINMHFLAAVSRGRGVAMSRVQEWADGRIWVGAKAQSLGLIDGVETFDTAMASLRQSITADARSGQHRRVAAEYSLRIAEMEGNGHAL